MIGFAAHGVNIGNTNPENDNLKGQAVHLSPVRFPNPDRSSIKHHVRKVIENACPSTTERYLPVDLSDLRAALDQFFPLG